MLQYPIFVCNSNLPLFSFALGIDVVKNRATVQKSLIFAFFLTEIKPTAMLHAR